MLNFLAEIKALEDGTSPAPKSKPRLEPRQTRRQKAREAAKSIRGVGAASVTASN